MTSLSAPAPSAFGPYSGPPGVSALVCPLCLDWQVDYPHEAGVGAVVEALVAAHLDECPLVPRRAVDAPGTRRNAALIRVLAWANRVLSR